MAALPLAGLAGLAACSLPTPATETETSAVVAPPGESATRYPLTLSSPFGDTVLKMRPWRLAVVSATTVDTDACMALGVAPVLAPNTLDRAPWNNQELMTAIETTWPSEPGAEVSAEVVAASRPDLIVALSSYETFNQEQFDKLKEIAPVLYAGQGDLTWQELTRQLGQALDLPAAAEKAITSAQDSVAQAKSTHPEFAGRSAAHVIVYEEEFGASYASQPGTDTAALFESLGFVLPQAASQFDDEGAISDELIGLIDADFLLVSTFEEGSADYFLNSSLYQAVPAVAQGRVAYNNEIDPGTGTNYLAWAMNAQSATSLPWLIDRVVALAQQALG